MNFSTKRVANYILQKDAYVLNAIQGISSYAPVRQEFTTENLLSLQQEMIDARRIEVQKEGELKAARDHSVQTEHRLHDAVLAAKDQIRAQYGISSDEYQSIGLKKKTEYKKPQTPKK
jgi:hypothetical protein